MGADLNRYRWSSLRFKTLHWLKYLLLTNRQRFFTSTASGVIAQNEAEKKAARTYISPLIVICFVFYGNAISTLLTLLPWLIFLISHLIIMWITMPHTMLLVALIFLLIHFFYQLLLLLLLWKLLLLTSSYSH